MTLENQTIEAAQEVAAPVATPEAPREDGIFINLSTEGYVRDRALSGSAFKSLLTEPQEYDWNRPDNPLAERAESEPRARGTAIHVAVLEGLEAYEARYCVPPEKSRFPRVLDTVDDMKEWLAEHGAKTSYKNKAACVQACLDIDANAPIWANIEREVMQGRDPMTFKADASIRLVTNMVWADPELRKILTGGIAELSIFWTDEDGIRYKARPDLISPGYNVEGKKYGVAPKMGTPLTRHLLGEAAKYAYPLQGVHNMRAIGHAARLLEEGRVFDEATGEPVSDHVMDQLRAVIPGEKKFYWLWMRTPGSPNVVATSFGPNQARWRDAENKIAEAVEIYKEWKARFGDEMWLRCDGLVETDDESWPMWA